MADSHRTFALWIRYVCYHEHRRFHTKGHSVVRLPHVFFSLLVIHFRLLFLDLMWSDPDDVENWAVSPRGAGWLFGGSVTQEVRR